MTPARSPGRRAPGRSFEEVARARAGGPPPSGTAPDARAFRRRLDDLESSLEAIHRRLHEDSGLPALHPRAAEWLLDNEPLTRRALQQVRDDLPPPFYRQLPVAGVPDEGGGIPLRVERLADAYVDAAEGRLETSSLTRFVEAWQDVRALTMGELWALPLFLRLSLLERLRATAGPLVEREGGQARPDASRRVGRLIESLRLASEEDWRDWFESVSRVERLLRRDPSGHYGRMTFSTRDRYRKAVEELARGSGAAEEEVAVAALGAAREAGGEGGDRRAHVGYHLVSDGRERLERELGATPERATRRHRWVRRHAHPLYFGGIGVLTALQLAVIGGILGGPGGAGPPLVAAVVLLALVPALTVAVAAVNWLVTHTLPPRSLPRLDLEGEVPPRWRTAVVVPCLLTRREEVEELLEKLEVLWHGNGGEGLSFVLLTDFADAPRQEMPGDEELLALAREGVRRLNRRYGEGPPGPFHLLHRERRWNPSEGVWMGWERKRGKLHEFNRLLLGEEAEGVEAGESGPAGFAVHEGEPAELEGTRLVVTLDADTRLPPGTARDLVGTLAHPLNRPELEGDRVVAGYSVLQPRLETVLVGRDRTPFARILEGETGLDLYSHAVSDAYMDLFGEGIYAGKGIYHVEAFERSLEGKVPENRLLSHDLFEGACGRAGLVTDLQMLEDYPSHVVAYGGRRHRWIRGDWQWLPWLFRRVPAPGGGRRPNFFSFLDRWKLADNLRRSLLAPSLLLFLACGWLAGPGPAWLWAAASAAVLALPVFLGAATATTRRLARLRGGAEVRRGRTSPRALLAHAARVVRMETARWAVVWLLLPYEAIGSLDAIGRTLYRLAVSRRRLLEWTSAAHAARQLPRGSPLRTWRELAGAVVVGLGLVGLSAWLRPAALPAALVLGGIWAVSPGLAHWLSLPPRRREARVPVGDRRFLRLHALRTWHFFERLVESHGHWLPPDNYRVEGGEVAWRTSPTNIGLMLTSAVSAWDLGYLGPQALEATLRNTLEVTERLEGHRGHLYNWYDIRDLRPLEPRYVSTVDSGNFAVCLLATAEGLESVPESPVLRDDHAAGLVDALTALEEVLLEVPASGGEAEGTLAELADAREAASEVAAGGRDPGRLMLRMEAEALPAIQEGVAGILERAEPRLAGGEVARLRTWLIRVEQQVRHSLREVRHFTPWVTRGGGRGWDPPAAVDALPASSPAARRAERLRRLLAARPALEEVPGVARRGREAVEGLRAALAEADGPPPGPETASWLAEIEAELRGGGERTRQFLEDLAGLRAVAERRLRETDFSFLYDRRRHLFHIGYNASSGEMDPHHYDLLASEARLASMVAMAKGDAPVEHWLHLGRPFAPARATPMLLSWAGSMFEYLLPAHFLKSPEDSLLHRSYRAAVDAQIRYGRRHRVPWGVSESGYLLAGEAGEHGYRAFGVPELGLKRETEERRVVTPYASFLALPLAPEAAVANLRRLADAGMAGTYGFYEALDFGPPSGRRGGGRGGEPVRSYMAHHQGMILLAVNNYLNEDRVPERVHRSPAIAGVEHLLHEKTPWQVPARRPWVEREPPPTGVRVPQVVEGWEVEEAAPGVQAHLLAAGDLRTLVTAQGAGEARAGDVELTAGGRDPTLEGRGTTLYVVDRESGEAWSTTRRPAGGDAGEARVVFAPHQATYHRVRDGLAAETRVFLPDPGVEARLLVLSNRTDRPRRAAASSYAELVLCAHEDFRRHPAYARLFVEREWLEEEGILLFRRRPGSPEGRELWLGHAVLSSEGPVPDARPVTDRLAFVGRGGGTGRPAALAGGGAGPERRAAPLDPVASLEVELALDAFESREVAFVTAVGSEREAVLGRLRGAGSPGRLHGRLGKAHDREVERMRRHDLSGGDLAALQRLLSALLFPDPGLRGSPERIRRNAMSRRGLWRHGISGDLPILLVRVKQPGGTSLVRRVVQAHGYWRELGQEVDLVLVSEEPPGYEQPLRDRMEALVERAASARLKGREGGIHLLQAGALDEDEAALLESASAVVLRADAGSLEEQLAAGRRGEDTLPEFVPMSRSAAGEEATPPMEEPAALEAWNGWGGFTPDGGEYVMRFRPDDPPPAPWANVVANPEFGFVASDAGLGCTWAGHAGERRLTPWRNDPVEDEPSEAVYVRDEETAERWTLTPRPRGADAEYEVRHAPGRTTYVHHAHGLRQELEVFVSPDDPVKLAEVRLTDLVGRSRRLTVTCYAEWVLGRTREEHAAHVVPDFAAEHETLLARNPFPETFGEDVAFLTAREPPHGLTADRREFLGRTGSRADPAGLRRIGLTGTVEAGRDPCAAYQVHVDLAASGTHVTHFVLGAGADEEAALELAARYRDAGAVEAAREASAERWEARLGTVTVRTPDPDLDRAVNRWLPYQTLASRLWGRTALYQSSGAYGFRDQLQDAASLLLHAPELARDHLLRAAARQFTEGDVLHWWHPESTTGVRTRCSDDLLWLPWGVAEYVEATGDLGVLDEEVAWLDAPPLEDEEVERFHEFGRTEATSPLLEHCLRAVRHADTEGPHGLPLIGSGDWNDGMNRVGLEGRGESVWLGWFLCSVLRRVADLCEARDEPGEALDLRARAEELAAAVEEHGWDGEWYRRAYYDDGTPLGSSVNDEARIDLISQAWAVLSGAGRPDRAARAMEAAWERLHRPDEDLLLLLAPPFDRTGQDPGYIREYPPGVRENGGQYSHAAAWAGLAYARLGDGERALATLRCLLPSARAATEGDARRYRVEPYVTAADVYGAPPHRGRGGWTWYTGSAGWTWRLAVEGLLGLRVEGGELRFEPCVPPSWEGYDVELRRGDALYRIRFDASGGGGRAVEEVRVDGEVRPDGRVALRDDGAEHEVRVRIGDGGSPVGG